MSLLLTTYIAGSQHPYFSDRSVCSHLALFMGRFQLKDVDNDRADLFQILTARTTATEDEVLEFSQALEKNMLTRSSFFALCRSMAIDR